LFENQSDTIRRGMVKMQPWEVYFGGLKEMAGVFKQQESKHPEKNNHSAEQCRD